MIARCAALLCLGWDAHDALERHKLIKNRFKVRQRKGAAVKISVPWVSFFRDRAGWSKDISDACNPNYGNCECLARWYHRPVCNNSSKPSVVIRVNRASHLFTGQEFAFGLHQCKLTSCLVTNKPITDYNAYLIGFPVDPSDSAFPRKSFKNQINGVVTIENPAFRPNMFEVACKSMEPCKTESAALFDDVDYHMSYRRISEAIPYIPVSYVNDPEAAFRLKPRPFAEKERVVGSVVFQCFKERKALVTQLMEHIAVDNLGSCLNNKEWPEECKFGKEKGQNWSPYRDPGKECLLSHYKFYLSFENTKDLNYTTEKLWQPLKMGAVPVVFGAPNLRDYLPHQDAAILVEDFASMKELGEYLSKAAADESLFNKHMAWKSQPFAPGFQYRIDHAPLNPYCSLCDYVKQHYPQGLGDEVVDDRSLEVKLHEATQTGDIPRMRQLIAQGADRNWQDGEIGGANSTLLMVALYAFKTDATVYLMEIGADPCLGDQRDMSAAHLLSFLLDTHNDALIKNFKQYVKSVPVERVYQAFALDNVSVATHCQALTNYGSAAASKLFAPSDNKMPTIKFTAYPSKTANSAHDKYPIPASSAQLDLSLSGATAGSVNKGRTMGFLKLFANNLGASQECYVCIEKLTILATDRKV